MVSLKLFSSYVVHVYRFKKGKPHSLVGLVEKAGSKGKRGFTNFDELWDILNSWTGNRQTKDFSFDHGKKARQ